MTSLAPGFRSAIPTDRERRPDCGVAEGLTDAAELGVVVAMAEGAAEFGGVVLALGSLEGDRRAITFDR
jgi:hypothetical protein